MCGKASNWALRSYSSDGVSRPTFADKRRARRELTKVGFNPADIVQILEQGLARDSRRPLKLQRWGFTGFETIPVEDLAAFEHSRDQLERSVDAWTRLLKSLGVEAINTTAVRTDLMEHGWGERPLAPHANTLHNYEQVAAAIRASPNARIRSFLREG